MTTPSTARRRCAGLDPLASPPPVPPPLLPPAALAAAVGDEPPDGTLPGETELSGDAGATAVLMACGFVLPLPVALLLVLLLAGEAAAALPLFIKMTPDAIMVAPVHQYSVSGS